MALARITVTVPSTLLRAADRRARDDDRSRSRIVTDALRAYLGESNTPAPRDDALATQAARARETHLRTEIALSPDERVARAEELVDLARERQDRAPREQVLAFDQYDDYYRWKLTRRIGA